MDTRKERLLFYDENTVLKVVTKYFIIGAIRGTLSERYTMRFLSILNYCINFCVKRLITI